MSRTQVSRHYARILSRWPADSLRPEVSFQTLLRKRIDAAPSPQGAVQNTAQAIPQTSRANPSSEMPEINALYSLLENRYTQQYPVSQSLMRPTSAPDHYTNLEREIKELPNRSWFGNLKRRLTGMIRLK